jgi:UTP--glucose-1-phosphate uridylyltransferase
VVNQFTEGRANAGKSIKRAVVPVAGWQSRLLAPAQIEAILRPAANEVVAAGIRELIIVVAPTMSSYQFAQLAKLNLSVREVVQEQQLGLGDALLKASHVLGEEPFAVVLPDDFDPDGNALTTITTKFKQMKNSLFMVSSFTVQDQPQIRFGGKATLGKEVKRGIHRVIRIRGKDDGVDDLESRSIFGRYVLTNRVLEVLRVQKRNPLTGQLELTDALATLISRQADGIYALELDRTLLPIAPLRGLMEHIITLLNQPRELARIMRKLNEMLRSDGHRDPRPASLLSRLILDGPGVGQLKPIYQKAAWEQRQGEHPGD